MTMTRAFLLLMVRKSVSPLRRILPTPCRTLAIHTADITNVSAKYRPCAAAGFAEDDRDITDENGREYTEYIKANAAKLAGTACEHPALLYLMVREKLIATKDLEAVTSAVLATGKAELIAAILDYTAKEKNLDDNTQYPNADPFADFVLDP